MKTRKRQRRARILLSYTHIHTAHTFESDVRNFRLRSRLAYTHHLALAKMLAEFSGKHESEKEREREEDTLRDAIRSLHLEWVRAGAAVILEYKSARRCGFLRLSGCTIFRDARSRVFRYRTRERFHWETVIYASSICICEGPVCLCASAWGSVE